MVAAYGLGSCHRICPVEAGTVNSNYFLETDAGRIFLRIYEQQEVEGVAYEWQLLAHLMAHGVPVPVPLKGPAPGELRIDGRPVALFPEVVGRDLCQAQVDAARAAGVGAALARAHDAGQRFPHVREGRFRLSDMTRLLSQAQAAARPELHGPLAQLMALSGEIEEVAEKGLAQLPRGVIHGDLFRDNVLWQDERLVALLDWESASHGVLVYDLAVTFLAWCCGAALDFGLGRAMVDGYRGERPLREEEWEGLWWACRLACLRFATTRIVDVHLKGGFPPSYKRYERFLLRLSAIEALTPKGLAAQLGG
jgi:homoserine kinase type II